MGCYKGKRNPIEPKMPHDTKRDLQSLWAIRSRKQSNILQIKTASSWMIAWEVCGIQNSTFVIGGWDRHVCSRKNKVWCMKATDQMRGFQESIALIRWVGAGLTVLLRQITAKICGAPVQRLPYWPDGILPWLYKLAFWQEQHKKASVQSSHIRICKRISQISFFMLNFRLSNIRSNQISRLL